MIRDQCTIMPHYLTLHKYIHLTFLAFCSLMITSKSNENDELYVIYLVHLILIYVSEILRVSYIDTQVVLGTVIV